MDSGLLAEPVIGPATSGRTRWLGPGMTRGGNPKINLPHLLVLFQIGRALMSEPRLLMLDEPSLGLAPTVVEALYDTLAELHRQGLTLLLAEQSIPLALGIADYAYVLQTGRIALEGPAAELEKNEQVREIYLGISAPAASG